MGNWKPTEGDVVKGEYVGRNFDVRLALLVFCPLCSARVNDRCTTRGEVIETVVHRRRVNVAWDAALGDPQPKSIRRTLTADEQAMVDARR